MQSYRQAFPNENIYIHSYFDNDANGKGYRYRFVYIWRALTPTGRVSKYYHAEHSNAWREDNHYPLPKLKRGYEWSGPFLYADHGNNTYPDAVN